MFRNQLGYCYNPLSRTHHFQRAWKTHFGVEESRLALLNSLGDCLKMELSEQLDHLVWLGGKEGLGGTTLRDTQV